MGLLVEGGAAILQQQTLIAAIIGVPHGRLHRAVGGDTRDDKVADLLFPEDGVEVGREEGAPARFVNYGLALARTKLQDDLRSRLASDEKPAMGSGRAYDDCPSRPQAPFHIREVGKIGAMAFAGEHGRKSHRPHRRENAPERIDNASHIARRDPHRPEPSSGRTKIDLHVDDKQRRVARREASIVGPRILARY